MLGDGDIDVEVSEFEDAGELAAECWRWGLWL